MRPTFPAVRVVAVAALLAVVAAIHPAEAHAQNSPPEKTKTLKLDDLFNQGGKPDGPLRSLSPKVSSSLSPKKVKTGDVVTLSVTLKLPPKAHVAPQKSESEFGLPTKIKTTTLTGLKEIDKDFTTTKKPTTRTDPKTGDKEVYFEGTITWTKKLRVVDAEKLTSVSAAGSIRYQVCVGGLCRPPKRKSYEARADVGSAEQPKTAEPKTAKKSSVSDGKSTMKAESQTTFPYKEQVRVKRFGSDDPIELTFELSPKNAAPGESVTFSITGKLDAGWHAFALTHEEGGIGLRPRIDVQKLRGLKPTGKGWRPDSPPKTHYDKAGRAIQEHYGTVVWKRSFEVTPGIALGEYGVSGRFSYQICKDGACKPRKTLSFKIGDLTEAADAPAESNKIDDSPFSPAEMEITERTTPAFENLASYLLLAFFGGLILNVMPCVLPVIAIKVMSFVQQAGEDRGRVFVLNSVYAVGVISVFLVLATLAVFMGYGWGGLFQRAEFTLIMSVIVFAMGLSLLGIYEIPLPGFFGSAAGKQHSEGPAGAFLTGVLATILATPCSGPFLGVTLAWSVRQPAEVTYLVWATMGLGMAFPYLVFAVFPKATRLLPKPGAWMVRFKEISGFVLMGTTVWIVHSLQKPELIYTLILVAASAFSLWMIGKLYQPTTPRADKWSIRTLALASVTFAAFAGSHVLDRIGEDGSIMFRFLQRWDMLAVATVFLGLSLAVLPFRAGMTTTSAGRRWLLHGTATVAVLLAAFGGVVAQSFQQSFAELPWQPYTEKTVNESIKKGNIVLIDFTADW